MNPPDQTTEFLRQHPLVAGMMALFVAVVVPLIRDFWKNQRERKADEMSQQYLKSIAESNQRLASGQGELNTLLKTSVEINTERHQSNLEAMKHICKCVSCENFMPPGNFGQQKQKPLSGGK